MPIREMQTEDFEAVQRVRAANGLGPQSRSHWDHLNNNPHQPCGARLPIGWVLENETGQVVGIHGAYPVRYRWRDKRLLAYVAHSLAVDAGHRRETLALLAPYFRQAGADLLITNSANRSSAPLFQFMQASKMPLAYYNQILSWVVNYRDVAGAAQGCGRRGGMAGRQG